MATTVNSPLRPLSFPSLPAAVAAVGSQSATPAAGALNRSAERALKSISVAPRDPSIVGREAARTSYLASISRREGEDAALTGGTRSLHRRLLALNLDQPRAPHGIAAVNIRIA